MQDKSTPTADIGVLVGRFQVHELHQAHRMLIDYVMARHKRVVIFLGVSPVLNSRRNPLDFESRRLMITESYPNVSVLPLPDRANDEVWSRDLDSRLREVFPTGSVVLYGGRDSFIPYYHGHFATAEFPPQDIFVSGTEVRKNVSQETRASLLFRSGVIYGAYNRYSISYQTVDIAVYDSSGRWLFARKPGEKGLRMLGGFVDASDPSLEAAAARELEEECGLKLDNMRYLGSARMDDWRYRSEDDKILTCLFAAEFTGGMPEPADDIAELHWLEAKDIKPELFEPVHRPLLDIIFRSSLFQELCAKTS